MTRIAENIKPCKYCEKPMNSNLRRRHQPVCYYNPKVRRRRVARIAALKQQLQKPNRAVPTPDAPFRLPQLGFRGHRKP